MSHFEEYGYQVLRGVVHPQTCMHMAIEFNMMKDNYMYANKIPLEDPEFAGDDLVKKSFSWYGPYCFESLLVMMHPLVQQVVEKPIVPTYSYARIYYNGASMAKHIDRDGGEIGVTCTISVDETGPWDIWIQDNKNNEIPLKLDVGDICIYSAKKNYHWRTPYTGKKQIQAFLFYVDANSDQIFDKRPMLGAPGHKWAKQ